jgi:hypothetical protein
VSGPGYNPHQQKKKKKKKKKVGRREEEKMERGKGRRKTFNLITFL